MKERVNGIRHTVQRDNFINEEAIAIVEHPNFEPALLVVTLLNVLVIGVEIDAHHLCTFNQWLAINSLFNLIYTWEVLFKMFAYGCVGYIKVPYNMFAFTVTFMAWVEIFVSLSLHETLPEEVADHMTEMIPGDLIQIIRIFRVVKMASVYRTFGVLLDSLIGACQGLGFVVVLAAMFFFVSACFGVVFIGRMEEEPGEKMSEGLKEVKEGFSNIPDCIWMLFELMLLEDFGQKVRPFITRHPLMVFCFIGFVFVTNFFILNLITAVVVDKMQRAQSESIENREMKKEEAKDDSMTELYARLLTLNEGNDFISFQDLSKWVREDQSVRHLVRKLRWNGKYMKETFRLCDHDYTHTASLLGILGIWVGCREQMTSALYARFQNHVNARMDYLDRLGTIAMEKAAQLVAARSKVD